MRAKKEVSLPEWGLKPTSLTPTLQPRFVLERLEIYYIYTFKFVSTSADDAIQLVDILYLVILDKKEAPLIRVLLAR